MKKSFFILLLFFTSSARTANENLLPTDKNVTIARKISHCVKEAARVLFAPSNDVSIIVPNQTYYSDVVQETLNKLIANVIVKVFTKFPNASNDESNSSTRDSSYVLIDNTEGLRQLLEQSYVSSWSEYIIVTEGTMKWLTEFAEYLWNLEYSKVAFVRVDSNGENKLLRLIRDPSSRSSAAPLVAYDLCNEQSLSSRSENNQKTSNIVHRFSSFLKIPVNATLKFTAMIGGMAIEEYLRKNITNPLVKDLGFEIIDIFASKYNMKVLQHSWGNHQESEWADAMNRCVAGDMDFFYSHSPPSNLFSLGLIDAMTWDRYETIVFVGRSTLSLHVFTGLLHAYGIQVWFLIFSILCVTSLFAYLIDELKHQGLIRERITVFNVWSVFVGQGLPKLPARFSLRFVLGMWIVYNLIISSVYTAIFGSDLTAPHEARQLKTFEDIVKSGKCVCIGKSIKEHFNDKDDPVMLAIYERVELVLPKHLFQKMLDEGCIAARHLSYVYEFNWKYRKDDSLRIYAIDEAVILNYPSFIYARKHHPYSRAFSKLVSNIRDSGIIRYLKYKYREKVDDVPLWTDEDQFLGLKHLTAIFCMLAIGFLISGMTFVSELYTYRRSGNQRYDRN